MLFAGVCASEPAGGGISTAALPLRTKKIRSEDLSSAPNSCPRGYSTRNMCRDIKLISSFGASRSGRSLEHRNSIPLSPARTYCDRKSSAKRSRGTRKTETSPRTAVYVLPTRSESWKSEATSQNVAPAGRSFSTSAGGPATPPFGSSSRGGRSPSLDAGRGEPAFDDEADDPDADRSDSGPAGDGASPDDDDDDSEDGIESTRTVPERMMKKCVASWPFTANRSPGL
mmetsp:Transcript_30595/g.99438  ORF Transcript_30595/g.99438 Transcript_30595/m.99438 type:complete len:228 (+) Transcript_30595:853-1536(+)